MKEGLLEIGDCQLWCVENKEGAQRDVILLHGAKFSAATWQEVGTLDVLSQTGYPVHALDMPGYGQSKPCPSPPVELLHEYITRRKFNAPILIGPSMGGSICLDYYFTWPDTVGGLVLVGAVGLEKHRDRFAELKAPCLLVWGENDTISPLSGARFIEQRIPAAELVVLEKASHPCYLDQPDKWHQSLLAFFNGNAF